MRLLAIEQTRSPQGKLRLRFDSGEAMLVLPAVVADLSLCPGMDIPDAARASLEAAAGSASADRTLICLKYILLAFIFAVSAQMLAREHLPKL